ncbi:MAG: hypothetical protein HFH75_18240 [Lachnospiraceae bacterium]|nr:hypothetical protein [Lachnospiraceae bacterium]
MTRMECITSTLLLLFLLLLSVFLEKRIMAGCRNENACLELTLSDGNVIRLSMAIDSCSNFGVNGVYYDYRPKTSWDNAEFYQYFDEIPFEY